MIVEWSVFGNIGDSTMSHFSPYTSDNSNITAVCVGVIAQSPKTSCTILSKSHPQQFLGKETVFIIRKLS